MVGLRWWNAFNGKNNQLNLYFILSPRERICGVTQLMHAEEQAACNPSEAGGMHWLSAVNLYNMALALVSALRSARCYGAAGKSLSPAGLVFPICMG